MSANSFLSRGSFLSNYADKLGVDLCLIILINFIISILMFVSHRYINKKFTTSNILKENNIAVK
jgi:hypothetical protein